MKRNLVNILVAFATIAAWGLIASCSESPTSETPTDVELRQVSGNAGEEFYPFDEPPVLVSYVSPDYPAEMQEHDLAVTVIVKLTISEVGRVENAEVISSTDARFDTSALEAARMCRFEPARLHGKPTKSRMAIPMRFAPNR